jgi:hypothetical protein
MIVARISGLREASSIQRAISFRMISVQALRFAGREKHPFVLINGDGIY